MNLTQSKFKKSLETDNNNILTDEGGESLAKKKFLETFKYYE